MSDNQMSILVDKDIIAEMELGNIVISPYDRSTVSNSSVDVTLGEWYFKNTTDGRLNPWLESDVREYWGSARRASSSTENDSTGFVQGTRYISIMPGELILAHTNEVIGGRGNITTMMKARSSVGRCGIVVCSCAGWGDVGYINRWTMEIKNNSQSTIYIPVGARIAQIVFLRCSDAPEVPYNGKYLSGTEWSPYDMLPKLYNDKDNIWSVHNAQSSFKMERIDGPYIPLE